MVEKRTSFNKLTRLFVLFSVSLVLILSSVNARAENNKDVILVLDTSMSMIGYGGKNIMPDVKDSINKYVDGLKDGDRVTFITFDKDVKVFPTVLIDDKNDRDIVKKYISVTEAKGEWTFTMKMLNQVFSLADKISKENGTSRNLVILIMTDALDDPPPGKRKDKFNLKNIADQYSGKDWWIYLVNLANLKESSKLRQAQEKLKGELSKISENSQIVDGSDPYKAINEKIQPDIAKKERVQFIIFILLALAAVLGCLLVLFLVIKRIKSVKLVGVLEFWNHELLKPEVGVAHLERYNAGMIIVGRVPGCQLKIREYESRIPFTLKASRINGEVKVQLLVPEGLNSHFKNKEAGNTLENGDIFQVENYSFRYLAENLSEDKNL